LDDTLFDFTGHFLAFSNERLGKAHVVPPSIDKWSPEVFFGINPKVMETLLNLYSMEFGLMEVQPVMPGAVEVLDWVTKSPEFARPFFVTVREPCVTIQTLAQLRNLYRTKNPSNEFSLLMANTKYTQKWRLMKELNQGSAPGSFFIDDNPLYINDAVQNCPSVITVWFNSRNMNTSLASPHFTVRSWGEVGELLKTPVNILLKNSRHGVQTEILV
jgi:hypothetical protein